MGIPASRKSARDVLRVSSMMLSYVWPCSSTGISTASFSLAGETVGKMYHGRIGHGGAAANGGLFSCPWVGLSSERSLSRVIFLPGPFRNPAVPTTSGISGGSMAGRSRDGSGSLLC